MVTTEKWIGGVSPGLTWTDAFTGTTLNSIASGNAILSDLSLTNGSNLDMFADVSFALASAAFTGTPFLGLYLYPLNKDGTTYGDGRFGSSAAGPPPPNYLVGYAGLVAATQAQEGFFSIPGMRCPIVIPPGTFKFVLYNAGGVALGASGNTCQYRTFSRQVA